MSVKQIYSIKALRGALNPENPLPEYGHECKHNYASTGIRSRYMVNFISQSELVSQTLRPPPPSTRRLVFDDCFRRFKTGYFSRCVFGRA